MNDFVRCKRLNEAFFYVSDEYLDLVELERKPERRNRKSFRAAIGTAAACICILLLPLGVLAARWFGIGDLILPKDEIDTPVTGTADISLSGYMDSPEAQALAEWNRFLEGYDTDQAILNQIGNEPVGRIREDWSFYGIYTHEMEEKLDEIAAKYGLKLHTECNVINQDELMKRVGGCFMDEESLTWAYMYEDGYFHVEGDIKLSESETVGIQMTRCVKGTFNNVILSVDKVEKYTEWQYISDCGETVLLALAPDNALIFADFEDCFVSVNVQGGSESGMTREDLQALADTIDFSILKDVQIPEMSGDSVVMPGDDLLLSELLHGEIGNLGTGRLVFTVPCDDKQDYRLYFFADAKGEELKAENADYIFPNVREGNIPIGTFQTFEVFQIGDIVGDDTQYILLVGIYGVGEELLYDARVYKKSGKGYVLDTALTQEWNEKYEKLPEESEHGQEESAGDVETNRNASDTVADKLILNELMYGNVGEPLGLGTLVYTIPQSSEEDYKVYFFASKNEDERYLSLSERNLELTEATYIFPDAREGNIPIGKFQEFYYFDTEDISSDGVADLLLIACYEVGDEVYYDTRVYVGNEDGYALDNTLTQKLNEKYYNVEEYPVWEVVELPHD